MGEIDLKKAEYYTNRELSWLGFNNRILGEARDVTLPLFCLLYTSDAADE